MYLPIQFDGLELELGELNLGGQMNMFSGGGSGGTGASGGGEISIIPSGGYDVLENDGYIPEGTSVYLSFLGETYGDEVVVTITNAGELTLDNSWTISNGEASHTFIIGSGAVVNFTVTQDLDFTEGDETFSVSLAVTSGNSHLAAGSSSFIFTIVEQVEFQSDIDVGLTLTNDNWRNYDTYRSYVKGDALVNTEDAVVVSRNVATLLGGSTVPNSNIQYSLVSSNVSRYFQLNVVNNVLTISLTSDAEDVISSINSYSCALQLKVEDSRLSDVSGGNVCSDLATFNITFRGYPEIIRRKY